MSAMTGLPRPKASPGWVTDERGYRTDEMRAALPLPWINGDAADEDGMADFFAFRDDCSRAGDERLCCICGDPLGAIVALGAMSGKRETSGGWGHPRCIQLAVRLCPHFANFGNEEVVAWTYEGPGVGVDEPHYEVDVVVETATPMKRADLARLARTDPWGSR